MTDTTDTRIAISVKEITKTAQSVPGIKGTPQEPPEKIGSSFPFITAFPISVVETWNTTEDSIFLYSIVIAIHVAKKDLAESYKRSVGLVELVIIELRSRIRKKGTALGYTHIDTFGETTSIYGELSYGGVTTLGWEVTLNDVKIRKDVP